MKRTPLLIIVAVLVAAVAAGVMLLRSKQAGSQASGTSSTTGPSPSTSGTNMANVSITLEEFGDYQCPPCGILHPELKKIKERYGSHLNIVFRNFPLTKIHKNAFAAAQAAEAARLQNHFWEMHDLLYENQSTWKDENDPLPVFMRYAGEIGLDLQRFSRDMQGAEVQRRIEEDEKRAESMGIQATPTVFVEGKQLNAEATTREGIVKAIELMMARKAH